MYSLGEADLAQMWSARCRMSISTAHDEHLIVGRLLIRSMMQSVSSVNLSRGDLV